MNPTSMPVLMNYYPLIPLKLNIGDEISGIRHSQSSLAFRHLTADFC